ncbi:MAG: hypothetical protein HYX75_08725 [Acidobacteria bacterium]|nr:hypothetical protein [Acidobacteriota bacterium]
MKPLLALLLGIAMVQEKRPAAGPYAAAVATLEFPELRDAARADRRVPIKVHYPKAEGRFPLAVYSHGGAGTWDAHLYEARYLASYGYAVLCPQHPCSDNVRLRNLITRTSRKQTGRRCPAVWPLRTPLRKAGS